MSLDALVKGKKESPIRALLYGVEGIGKSTFAANAPAPIFIGAEDGTAQLDVVRFPSPENWNDVKEAVRELTSAQHDYRTAVIDTLDWAEPLLWEFICQRDKQTNIEAYGYGKGYTAALDEWRVFVAMLEKLRREQHMNVILVAHSVIKPFKNPEADDFDRYELKLNGKAAGLLKEWCDAVLFANYETFAMPDAKTKRVKGVDSGARIIHTQRRAAYDAKNRYGLPETLPLSWQEFEAATKASAPEESALLLSRIQQNATKLGGEFEKYVQAHLVKNKANAAWLAELDNRLKANLLKKAEAHNVD
jgi:hypothetical protein